MSKSSLSPEANRILDLDEYGNIDTQSLCKAIGCWAIHQSFDISPKQMEAIGSELRQGVLKEAAKQGWLCHCGTAIIGGAETCKHTPEPNPDSGVRLATQRFNKSLLTKFTERYDLIPVPVEQVFSVEGSHSGRIPFLISLDVPDMLLIQLALSFGEECTNLSKGGLSVECIQIESQNGNKTGRLTLFHGLMFPFESGSNRPEGLLPIGPATNPPLLMKGQRLVVQGHTTGARTLRLLAIGWSPREQNCLDHPANQPPKDSEPEQQSPDESNP